MKYLGYIIVAALVGALAGCEEPYYQAYGYIYKSDYYYPSGHAR
jgi:hypothetical protein